MSDALAPLRERLAELQSEAAIAAEAVAREADLPEAKDERARSRLERRVEVYERQIVDLEADLAANTSGGCRHWSLKAWWLPLPAVIYAVDNSNLLSRCQLF